MDFFKLKIEKIWKNIQIYNILIGLKLTKIGNNLINV